MRVLSFLMGRRRKRMPKGQCNTRTAHVPERVQYPGLHTCESVSERGQTHHTCGTRLIEIVHSSQKRARTARGHRGFGHGVRTIKNRGKQPLAS